MPIPTRLLLAVALLASWLPTAAQTTATFAKGADISWVREMEASNGEPDNYHK